MSKAVKTGFAVIYQWRLKAGKEAQFHDAWNRLTVLLRERRGARGSRLHHTDNGTLVAYAQWPNRAQWERSCALHKLDEDLSQQMLDSVEETYSPMLLTTVADHLLSEQESEPHVTTH